MDKSDSDSDSDPNDRSSTLGKSGSSSPTSKDVARRTDHSAPDNPTKQHKQDRLKSAEAKRRMLTNLSKEALQVTGNAMADSPGLKGGPKGRAKSVACVML